jgi:hypothetical protein
MAVFPAVAATRIGGRWLNSALRREAPEAGRSQLAEASSLANTVFGALYRVEAPLAARFRLPFGVSIVAIARRGGSTAGRRPGPAGSFSGTAVDCDRS